ncbi:kelch-like protein 3 [Mizuhopecten yessoensis]|uniref:Kelch-like protein 3 n=1 Tax=Mizuhopecten yessoensis TaxID=6573 RepID=A0A210PPT0_MIZYE|nr:kelch-like protein 3 [Mizuhopecten yessoensis]OWF38510.1 Kelch-like protein 3 [Mizuhopecten yessoensis]
MEVAQFSKNHNSQVMIDSRRFTIQSQPQNAFTVMHDLRVRRMLCDVVITVEGKDFDAHKVVLCGCSPYLLAMFTNGMQESEQEHVHIRGLEAWAMELLLEFMYTSEIEITVDNVQGILQGASLLGLHHLRKSCATFLQSQLTAANCLGINFLADLYMCTDLEALTRQFIYQNFLEVMHYEEFLQLSEERLLALLKSDKLQVTNEHQVLEAVCGWLQGDEQNRTPVACNLLQYVKLPLLGLNYLENVVLKFEFVKNCPKCQLLISKAINMHHDETALTLVTPRAQPPCIYVMGGRNSTDCQLKSMEKYDFLIDQWNTVTNMNIARTAVGAVSVDGVLYAVGGECALADTQEDTLYLRCMECYDPVLRQWIPKPEMKIARSFVACVAVGRMLYAIGGEDGSCSYCIVEKYDQRQELWSFAASMNRKRAGAGTCVCDGKIYVAGGYDKILHLDRASVECFDPATEEWTFVSEMEKARSGLALVSVEHCIYAFGGRYKHTDQYTDMVERFNTLTNQWTTISSMNTPRAWPGIAAFDGKIYLMGGFDGTSRLRSAEVYDIESDRWAFLSNMTVSRAGCGAAVV